MSRSTGLDFHAQRFAFMQDGYQAMPLAKNKIKCCRPERFEQGIFESRNCPLKFYQCLSSGFRGDVV